MADGDIIQFSAYMGVGESTVQVDGTDGQPDTWATPTSGNTLIALFLGRSAVSSGPSGFSLEWSDDQTTPDNEYIAVYTKTSAGTETSISITPVTSTEDHAIGVWEIEGDVTYDTNAWGNETAGTSVDSGLTATLAGSSSVAVVGAMRFGGTQNVTFSDSYVLDVNWDSGTNNNMFYNGFAHKALTGTTATETTASWTSSTDGWIGLSVFTIDTTQQENTTGIMNGGGGIAASVLHNTTTGTVNGGGSLSATAASFVGQTARPISTTLSGSWDTGPTTGQDLHTYAGDDSDATWIEDTAV